MTHKHDESYAYYQEFIERENQERLKANGGNPGELDYEALGEIVRAAPDHIPTEEERQAAWEKLKSCDHSELHGSDEDYYSNPRLKDILTGIDETTARASGKHIKKKDKSSHPSLSPNYWVYEGKDREFFLSEHEYWLDDQIKVFGTLQKAGEMKGISPMSVVAVLRAMSRSSYSGRAVRITQKNIATNSGVGYTTVRKVIKWCNKHSILFTINNFGYRYDARSRNSMTKKGDKKRELLMQKTNDYVFKAFNNYLYHKWEEGKEYNRTRRNIETYKREALKKQEAKKKSDYIIEPKTDNPDPKQETKKSPANNELNHLRVEGDGEAPADFDRCGLINTETGEIVGIQKDDGKIVDWNPNLPGRCNMIRVSETSHANDTVKLIEVDTGESVSEMPKGSESFVGSVVDNHLRYFLTPGFTLSSPKGVLLCINKHDSKNHMKFLDEEEKKCKNTEMDYEYYESQINLMGNVYCD